MGIRQVKRPMSRPSPHCRSPAARPWPNYDQFNPLMTLQFETNTSTLRSSQERERMSSVLKKRRKKMRKHKYKKLRRRQKFERRKS
jgi:hypothetical protein